MASSHSKNPPRSSVQSRRFTPSLSELTEVEGEQPARRISPSTMHWTPDTSPYSFSKPSPSRSSRSSSTRTIKRSPRPQITQPEDGLADYQASMDKFNASLLRAPPPGSRTSPSPSPQPSPSPAPRQTEEAASPAWTSTAITKSVQWLSKTRDPGKSPLTPPAPASAKPSAPVLPAALQSRRYDDDARERRQVIGAWPESVHDAANDSVADTSVTLPKWQPERKGILPIAARYWPPPSTPPRRYASPAAPTAPSPRHHDATYDRLEISSTKQKRASPRPMAGSVATSSPLASALLPLRQQTYSRRRRSLAAFGLLAILLLYLFAPFALSRMHMLDNHHSSAIFSRIEFELSSTVSLKDVQIAAKEKQAGLCNVELLLCEISEPSIAGNSPWYKLHLARQRNHTCPHFLCPLRGSMYPPNHETFPHAVDLSSKLSDIFSAYVEMGNLAQMYYSLEMRQSTTNFLNLLDSSATLPSVASLYSVPRYSHLFLARITYPAWTFWRTARGTAAHLGLMLDFHSVRYARAHADFLRRLEHFAAESDKRVQRLQRSQGKCEELVREIAGVAATEWVRDIRTVCQTGDRSEVAQRLHTSFHGLVEAVQHASIDE